MSLKLKPYKSKSKHVKKRLNTNNNSDGDNPANSHMVTFRF